LKSCSILNSSFKTIIYLLNFEINEIFEGLSLGEKNSQEKKLNRQISKLKNYGGWGVGGVQGIANIHCKSYHLKNKVNKLFEQLQLDDQDGGAMETRFRHKIQDANIKPKLR
jgi:hypothetical protein